jgi:hypothetical protein
MQRGKKFVICLFLILVAVSIGCSSGGSSSGGSNSSNTDSTPAVTTNPLVGTWKADAGGPSLVFNADGSGYLTDGVHGISGWTLNSTNVLNLKLNGTPEVFQLTWTNEARTKMTLHNIGPNSSETTSYTKG